MATACQCKKVIGLDWDNGIIGIIWSIRWPTRQPPGKNGGAGISAATPSPRHTSSDLAGALFALEMYMRIVRKPILRI